MNYLQFLNENLFIPNKDIYINFEDWGKSKTTAILWVTGFSGSGKSTISKKLADDKTILLSLDEIHHFLYKDKPNKLERYIYKNVPEYTEIAKSITKGKTKEEDYIQPELETIFIMVLLSIIIFSEENYKKYKIICEGFQIYNFVPFSFINGQPLIIKGTSALKSFLRRIKRDGISESNNFYEYLKHHYKWYIEDNRKIETLKKHIKLYKFD